MNIYRVKPGDSIWRISNKFRVSPQAVIDANGLDAAEYIVPGMNLLIPTKSPSATYTVKPGDTPWSIAKKFNITVSQLITANNLSDPYTIYPGQAVYTKAILETLGYFIPSRVQDRTLFINSMARYLTYLAVFDFPVTASGQITGALDLETLTAARGNDVALLPVLTNLVRGEFSGDLGHTVISDPLSRSNLINNIIAFLQNYSLRGVVIDFENLFPQDRNMFTQFIQELYTRLHSEGEILVLNVAPKWEDWPDREWAGFFDYNRLGPIIDIAAIMTYEWGWRTGPPRATAPIPYIKRVLDYATQNNIPANKIYLGLTLYGYDWRYPYVPGNLAATVTLPEVWNLARTYNASILFSSEARQPYLRYADASGQQHEVWFEDAQSHYYKYQIVNKYGIAGAFYWLIDQPFPATWNMASDLFTIRKL